MGLATPSHIGVWLLFKLGCYGVAWYSFRMRERAAEMSLIDLVVIPNGRANALAMTCLFATRGNLFVAILGAVCGALVVAVYEHPWNRPCPGRHQPLGWKMSLTDLSHHRGSRKYCLIIMAALTPSATAVASCMAAPTRQSPAANTPCIVVRR